MIRTVAEFLLGLKEREATRLAEVDIDHGPTIGQMYEGLSKELLGRAIPPQLGLQVVSGFITDGLGGRSGQIDCMLVRGEGEAIPYTEHFVWHVKDVIAVFEIKKTLMGEELADAISHLGRVRELESSYFQSLRGDKESTMDADAVESGYRAFAETTGVVGDYDNEASLPVGLRSIFHTIMLEPFKTIRVVLGYDGFRTEAGFRRALIAELGKRLGSWVRPLHSAATDDFRRLLAVQGERPAVLDPDGRRQVAVLLLLCGQPAAPAAGVPVDPTGT